VASAAQNLKEAHYGKETQGESQGCSEEAQTPEGQEVGAAGAKRD
jgi:hypothetical protein